MTSYIIKKRVLIEVEHEFEVTAQNATQAGREASKYDFPVLVIGGRQTGYVEPGETEIWEEESP